MSRARTTSTTQSAWATRSATSISALKYVDTTLDEGDFGFSDDDVFNNEGRVIFTIATTFPWGEE